METPFEGTVSQMKANKWLGAEDLFDRGEVVMTITGVFSNAAEKMQDGKEKDFYTIGFDKTPKRLILNATNRKTLTFSFGTDPKKWAGNKVTLFVQNGVKNPNGGAPVSGIRIKTDKTPSK